MQLDPMNQVPMYVLVAPDGTPQTSTFGQDLPESFAITKLMAKAGKSRTPEALIREGMIDKRGFFLNLKEFRSQPIKL